MSGDVAPLDAVIAFLAGNEAVAAKVAIHDAYAPAIGAAGAIRLGDDCAAIPDGNGHLLLAAEGMLPGFVADDPWFAGYCAVMVNISDIAAMGGRALAIVDILWAAENGDAIWAGMNAASRAYGVPIVGGHTTPAPAGASYLAAAVMGRAERGLITSFGARAGDDLLMAVDLRGAYRGGKPFWNASTEAPHARLRGDLELLPALADSGACTSGKDISNGGIVGTLAMLLECSGVGAELNLDALPMPPEVELTKWLISFPSFGFLLTAEPSRGEEVIALFNTRGIACARVGSITASRSLSLSLGGATRVFLEARDDSAGWRLHATCP